VDQRLFKQNKMKLYNIGDIRNGSEVLPIDKRKKILLLSDDLRMSSGIANVSKELVLGTIHRYNWVQVGAAINHPEAGKMFDLSQDAKNVTGLQDASLKVLPFNGYGNPDLLRQLMMMERPHAILHFTDPRFWTWLYEIEHEVRQTTPLFFYHIWDDLPDPKYNRDYYESCDWIGCISKQTYGITKRVWSWDKYAHWKKPEDWQVSYVPHGIDPEKFFKTDVPVDFKKSVFGDNEYEFVLFFNNRNIRRKQPIDVMMAFNEFRKKLPVEKQNKVCLIMHTQPVDENGTDLPRTYTHLMPDAHIIFSQQRGSQQNVNWLYNLSDVTINISSNEGFGLATAESLMAETPILVNITGGLQDQCGFRDKKTGLLLTAEDYVKIGSLHNKKLQDTVTWGSWVKPIWPVRSTTGSVPTPYIFDDRVDFEDVAKLIMDWYNTPKEERNAAGKEARAWMLGDGKLSQSYMCESAINGMETAWKNWNPRKKYTMIKI
jgi:glycosyltransferase involved in cell wall biosynthesis